MSGIATPDLSAATIIERIGSGDYSREVVLTIAQGFLPLPQEDLIAILAFLSGEDDAEVADLARMSLEEVPLRSAMAFAANEEMSGAHLGNLLRATRDSSVVETLIRNRSLPDNDIIVLAGRAEPAVQEVIVINQARILRAPQIIEMLLTNPKLSPDVRRRALETREEFFEKKARVQEEEAAGADEPAVLDIPLDAIADLLERAAAEPQPDTPPPELHEFEKKDVEKASVWAKIQKMTVAQKVMLAFRGDKTCRMILVRDRNRLVCSAVMRNPRMGETEAEIIAGMRNVDDEVIRLLTMRRDWMQKYTIVNNLCHNPKTPVGVVLTLINRLTLRDLKALKEDKNVGEVVRQQAKKFYVVRTQRS